MSEQTNPSFLKREYSVVDHDLPEFIADRPTFFWRRGNDLSWNRDLLEGKPIIAADGQRIAFDYPVQGVPKANRLVDMQKEADGLYHWRQGRNHNWGRRSDIGDRLDIRGRWHEPGDGGEFVAIFPSDDEE